MWLGDAPEERVAEDVAETFRVNRARFENFRDTTRPTTNVANHIACMYIYDNGANQEEGCDRRATEQEAQSSYW